MNPIVIVGGGHAGAQLCSSLVEAGLGAQVHLVCAESHLPYQRPPLSKAYLKNPAEGLQLHRAQAWFEQAGITLHLGDPAVSIDRAAQRLRLRSGTELPYGQLVLATGAGSVYSWMSRSFWTTRSGSERKVHWAPTEARNSWSV